MHRGVVAPHARAPIVEASRRVNQNVQPVWSCELSALDAWLGGNLFGRSIPGVRVPCDNGSDETRRVGIAGWAGWSSGGNVCAMSMPLTSDPASARKTEGAYQRPNRPLLFGQLFFRCMSTTSETPTASNRFSSASRPLRFFRSISSLKRGMRQ